MTESVTAIIVARSQEPRGLRLMTLWSVATHLVLVALMAAMPGSWFGREAVAPRTVMTISLSGATGPRAGGMTQAGGRTVQAPPPIVPARRVEARPTPQQPRMVLPDRATTPPPRVRPAEGPEEAPQAAAGEPQEGSTRADTGARGQGFGLSTGGGGGTGVQLDVGNFCCPEYLEQMVAFIQRNWQAKQGVAGAVTMRFAVTRSGSIEQVHVEQPSGFYALDLAAQRALLLTKLPGLPQGYSNPELTVHMRFEYSRQ